MKKRKRAINSLQYTSTSLSTTRALMKIVFFFNIYNAKKKKIETLSFLEI